MEEAGWRCSRGWLSTKTNTYTVILCSFEFFLRFLQPAQRNLTFLKPSGHESPKNWPDLLIRTKIGPNYAGSGCPDKISKFLLSWVKIRTQTMKWGPDTNPFCGSGLYPNRRGSSDSLDQSWIWLDSGLRRCDIVKITTDSLLNMYLSGLLVPDTCNLYNPPHNPYPYSVVMRVQLCFFS